MSEHLSSPEEREEGREYEAEQLLRINECAQEMVDVAWREGGIPSFTGGPIFDHIYYLGKAIARRDPEFGRILVQKLTARAASNDVRPTEADTHEHLAGQIQDVLDEPSSQ